MTKETTVERGGANPIQKSDVGSIWLNTLLLTFFERYVALNCFYFNTHNSNRFFNG